MNTYCVNAGKKSGEKFRDNTGKKFIVCNLTGEKCISQRYCINNEEYIVSENANRYCKRYKK